MTTAATAARGPDEPPPVVAPPPGHPRFPLVDSLRGLAALTVLLAHVTKINGTAPGPWGTVLYNLGQHTLATFFILSAFLIYRPFVNAQMNGAPRPPLARFFWRRSLRIVPAYWVALTLLALYPTLPGVFTGDWWKYYFLLSAYSEETVSGGLLVSWTMCAEVAFYLLLPFHVALLAWLGPRLSLARRVQVELGLLALISLASVALRALDQATTPTAAIQNSLPSLYFWFALGMALAVVSSAGQGREPAKIVRSIAGHPGLCWGIAGAILVVLAMFMSTDGTYNFREWIFGYYVLSGVVSLFLFMPAVFVGDGGGWPRRFMALPLLGWLGLVAYGVYLWHVPLISWFYTHDITSTPALAVAGVLGSVAAGAASYYAVERPVLRFKNVPLRRRVRSAPHEAGSPAPATRTIAR